jgi:hypothetical protein
MAALPGSGYDNAVFDIVNTLFTVTPRGESDE